jgi:hypothetical protein
MTTQSYLVTAPMPQQNLTWSLSGGALNWMATIPIDNGSGDGSLTGLSVSITDSSHPVNNGTYPIINFNGSTITITSATGSTLLPSTTITLNSILWTVPAGVTSCRVRGVGGGGGGGGSGAAAHAVSAPSSPGAGGAASLLGEVWFGIFSSPQINPGNQIAIVPGQMGAGGAGATTGIASPGSSGQDSTFGGTIISTGGQGGSAGVDNNTVLADGPWYSPGGVPSFNAITPIVTGTKPVLQGNPPGFGGFGTSDTSMLSGTNGVVVRAGGGCPYYHAGQNQGSDDSPALGGGGGGCSQWPNVSGSGGGSGGAAGALPSEGNNGTSGGGGGGGGAATEPGSGTTDGVFGGSGGGGVVQVIWEQ